MSYKCCGIHTPQTHHTENRERGKVSKDEHERRVSTDPLTPRRTLHVLLSSVVGGNGKSTGLSQRFDRGLAGDRHDASGLDPTVCRIPRLPCVVARPGVVRRANRLAVLGQVEPQLLHLLRRGAREAH